MRLKCSIFGKQLKNDILLTFEAFQGVQFITKRCQYHLSDVQLRDLICAQLRQSNMHFGKSILVLAMMAVVIFAQKGKPGGKFPITNLDDQGLKNAVSHAISHLEAQSNKAVKVSLVAITKAQYQIVAGKNYFFTATVRVANDGGLEPLSATTTCSFTVFRNLQGQHSVTRYGCKDRDLFN